MNGMPRSSARALLPTAALVLVLVSLVSADKIHNGDRRRISEIVDSVTSSRGGGRLDDEDKELTVASDNSDTSGSGSSIETPAWKVSSGNLNDDDWNNDLAMDCSSKECCQSRFWQQYLASDPGSIPVAHVEECVLFGIPEKLRAQVWWRLADLERVKATAVQYGGAVKSVRAFLRSFSASDAEEASSEATESGDRKEAATPVPTYPSLPSEDVPDSDPDSVRLSLLPPLPLERVSDSDDGTGKESSGNGRGPAVSPTLDHPWASVKNRDLLPQKDQLFTQLRNCHEQATKDLPRLEWLSNDCTMECNERVGCQKDCVAAATERMFESIHMYCYYEYMVSHAKGLPITGYVQSFDRTLYIATRVFGRAGADATGPFLLLSLLDVYKFRGMFEPGMPAAKCYGEVIFEELKKCTEHMFLRPKVSTTTAQNPVRGWRGLKEAVASYTSSFMHRGIENPPHKVMESPDPSRGWNDPLTEGIIVMTAISSILKFWYTRGSADGANKLDFFLVRGQPALLGFTLFYIQHTLNSEYQLLLDQNVRDGRGPPTLFEAVQRLQALNLAAGYAEFLMAVDNDEAKAFNFFAKNGKMYESAFWVDDGGFDRPNFVAC